MAKYRIKVNKRHPVGSINMRNINDERITVSANDWTPVDAISPSMKIWEKFLVIEPIPLAGKTKIANVSEDSTEVKMGTVPVDEKPKPKRKGK